MYSVGEETEIVSISFSVSAPQKIKNVKLYTIIWTLPKGENMKSKIEIFCKKKCKVLVQK